MKLLGIDFGGKNTGLAICEASLPRPYKLIKREKENVIRPLLRDIGKICEEEKIEKIILGLPLNLDGSESDRSKLTKEFGEKLAQRVNVPIVLWDERLTTKDSEERMRESGIKKDKQKEMIDMVAACLILETYIEKEGNEKYGRKE